MSADGTFQQQASSGRATQCARQDPVANGSFAAAGRVEGIEHADITASKVGEIAGDQDQLRTLGMWAGSSQECDEGVKRGPRGPNHVAVARNTHGVSAASRRRSASRLPIFLVSASRNRSLC